MAVFFTSDTHFGHGNIIKYSNRPFLTDEDKAALAANGGTWHRVGDWKGSGSSPHRITTEAVQMMDDTIIDNINRTVGRNDELYHLGDFCMAGKKDHLAKCQQYRDRIRCRNIHLIWGNHDDLFTAPMFSSVHDLLKENFGGQVIVMCHYAMVTWNKSHRGAWHLYGHSHSEIEPWMDTHLSGRRSMDVGVDNAYKLLGEFRPFSFDEVAQFLRDRPGFGFGGKVPTNTTAPEETTF